MNRSFKTTFVSTLALAALLCLPFVAQAGDEEPHVLFLEDRCEGSVADCLSFFGKARGYLGVRLLDLTPELRVHFGADDETGAMISKVIEDSPADLAGLAVGDIITNIDGEPVGSARQLAARVGRKEKGESLQIDFLRDGAPISTQVEVGENERRAHGGNIFFDIQDLKSHPGLFTESEAFNRALEGLNSHDLEEALKEAGKALDGMDWSKYTQRLESIDFGDLEERLETLQERMQELEERLEEDYENRK